MSEPEVFKEAVALIRNGQRQAAVDRLQSAIAEIPVEYHRKAHSYTGLAFYFDQRWAEALSYFTVAAEGSEIPEDHFNVAMARVKLGDIEGAHTAWQRCFDLSYAHQNAPETSTFFTKKLLFAQALADAHACDARGLDLLERQLMGFFTHHHVTDASFWGMRGVPGFEEVMESTLTYYREMGKSGAEWRALCDRVSAEVDSEGQAYCEEMKAQRGAGA